MTPELIRAIWKLLQVPGTIELSRSHPDRLVNQLVESLRKNGNLTDEGEPGTRSYIRSRLPLMCDLLNEGHMTKTHYATSASLMP